MRVWVETPDGKRFLSYDNDAKVTDAEPEPLPEVKLVRKISPQLLAKEMSTLILTSVFDIIQSPLRNKDVTKTKAYKKNALVNECRLAFGDLLNDWLTNNPDKSMYELSNYFSNTWRTIRNQLQQDFETSLPEILGTEYDPSAQPAIRKQLWVKDQSKREKMSGVLKEVFDGLQQESRRFDPDRRSLGERFNQIKNDKRTTLKHTVNLPEINPYPIIEKAKSLLEDVYYYMQHPEQNNYPFNYLDVSCALALVTGRRMAEIHATGIFIPQCDFAVPRNRWYNEIEPEHWCYVTGLIKNNKYSEERTVIPLLANSQHVDAGIKYLGFARPTKGANAYKVTFRCETTSEVNKRFSKYLPDQARKEWRPIGCDEHFSYHAFRDVYLTVCREEFKPMPMKEDVFCESILCDTSTSVRHYQTYRINKELTNNEPNTTSNNPPVE